MSLNVMPKTAVPEWLDRLCGHYRVIGPKRVRGDPLFSEIHSAAEVDWGYATTPLPPKKALLPPREELFTFKGNGHDLEPHLDEQPTVILGLHTCDLHAIALLDRVFSQGFADQHYLARRKNTTLVSIECLAPCSQHAFCKDMGSLIVPDEFDLHLTDLGAEYAIEIGSEKGAVLLQSASGDASHDASHEATADDYRCLNQVIGEKWPRFPYRLEADVTELPGLLSVGYRSTLWDELGERCLSCGACTLVCPTCYCFNVMDEVDFSLKAGSRFRAWDSCQLAQFAVVAGGHDFRAGRAARLRHRFSRKYKYLTDAYERVGCVGCGRCARACLVHITPVDTLNQLYKRQVSHTRRQEEVAA